MIKKTFTLELPDSVQPERLSLIDQEFFRYITAGILYMKGIISGKEAREITGLTQREFEENMAKYGFVIMPDTDKDIEIETKTLQDNQSSKWALLSQEVQQDDTFTGLGTQILADVKEFRENFTFKRLEQSQ
ncbi:MAG: UPF0175 family protein [Nitrospirae bacterium YQR-1]